METKRLVEAFEQGYIYIKSNPTKQVPVKSIDYNGVIVEVNQAGYKTTATYTANTYGTYWGNKPEDIR